MKELWKWVKATGIVVMFFIVVPCITQYFFSVVPQPGNYLITILVEMLFVIVVKGVKDFIL